MSSPPGPSKKFPKPAAPGDVPPSDHLARIASLARELAQNPNSPLSLQIQSAVQRALAPREKASNQVVDALLTQLLAPSVAADASLKQAISAWEGVFNQPMGESDLQELRQLAHRIHQRRDNGPPPMESFIGEPPARTDTLYDLGLSLDGLKGCWHRLWAILVLTHDETLGGPNVQAVVTVRQQFEAALGRPLTDPQWLQLVAHARRHAESRSGSNP